MANAEVFYLRGIPTNSLPQAVLPHAANSNCVRLTAFKQIDAEGQVSWHLEAMYRVAPAPEAATAPQELTIAI